MSGKIDLSSCIATSRTNDLTCSNIEIGNQALCSMTDILKLAVELYQAVVVSLGQDVRGWMPVISSIHTVRSPSFARSIALM